LEYHGKVRLLGYPPHLLVAGYSELLGFAGCVISALFVMIPTGSAHWRLFHAAGRFCENVRISLRRVGSVLVLDMRSGSVLLTESHR